MEGAASRSNGVAAPERVCEYRHCDESLDGRRPQCRFCSPACRAAESRERAVDRAVPFLAPQKPHSSVSRRPRRANREGVGTRLYVTAADIDVIEQGLEALGAYGVGTWAGNDALKHKLKLAAERVARKGEK